MWPLVTYSNCFEIDSSKVCLFNTVILVLYHYTIWLYKVKYLQHLVFLDIRISTCFANGFTPWEKCILGCCIKFNYGLVLQNLVQAQICPDAL